MKRRPALAAFLGLATVLLSVLLDRLRSDDPDRGDVPGWVMLTLMSAVLVAGLLLIAQPALEGLFQGAMARVSQG